MKPLGTYSPSRVVDFSSAKMVFLSGLTSGGEAPRDTKAQAQIVFDRDNEARIEIEGVAVVLKGL